MNAVCLKKTKIFFFEFFHICNHESFLTFVIWIFNVMSHSMSFELFKRRKCFWWSCANDWISLTYTITCSDFIRTLRLRFFFTFMLWFLFFSSFICWCRLFFVLFFTVLFSTVLFFTVLFSTVLTHNFFLRNFWFWTRRKCGLVRSRDGILLLNSQNLVANQRKGLR